MKKSKMKYIRELLQRNAHVAVTSLTKTMAGEVVALINECPEDNSRYVVLRRQSRNAICIQVEPGSSDPTIYWLMKDHSVFRIANHNEELYPMRVVEWLPNTIAGAEKRDELINLKHEYTNRYVR